jgi:pimeloyl-ACP methyl ester carboxylesterase
MRIDRTRWIGAAVTMLALAVPACTGSSDAVPATPRLETAPCPSDVKAQIVLPHSCGYLTVPADRDEPDGATVRLLVVRVQPPGGMASNDDPMYIPGTDLAVMADYVGTAPMAQRIDREVIIMDQRGTAHSEPSLACPEVAEEAAATASAATDDPAARSAFLDAVRSCFDRLTQQDIDPSDFTLASMAADGEDLRRALDIAEWNITTHGSASRIALEMMRRYPSHIRSVVLDSPSFPQVDPFTEAIRGTRDALEQIARACEQDRDCSRTYPDLGAAAADSLETLRDAPERLEGPSAGPVVLDDAAFLRALRQMAANYDVPLGTIPAAVYAVLDGRLSDVSPSIAQTIQQMFVGQTYCVGYWPKCTPGHEITEGAAFSILCTSIVPFIDRAEVSELARDPSYASAFADSPWIHVCDHWDVEPAEDVLDEPVQSDIPTLVLIDPFDPYAPPPLVGEATALLSGATLVEVPGRGHNVLGGECGRLVRNPWVDDPSAPLEVPSCALEGQGPDFVYLEE